MTLLISIIAALSLSLNVYLIVQTTAVSEDIAEKTLNQFLYGDSTHRRPHSPKNIPPHSTSSSHSWIIE